MSKKNKKKPQSPPKKAVVEEPVQKQPTTVFSFFDHPFLPLALILVVTFVTYWTSTANDFVAFDDDKSIWYNQNLRNPSFKGIFGQQLVGMYVPITSLIYTMIFQGFGENAGVYHWASLFVHLINVVLVYKLFQKLQSKSWIAFFVALFFAIHPMLTEAISWVSALSTLMFSCFYLLSLHLFLSYLDGNGKRFYWFALLAFLFAGLSKSAAATLPLMLVAMDWWRNKKLNLVTILDKWPFWLLSLGLIVLTFFTRTAEGHDLGAGNNFNLIDRVFMISHTLFFYPVKLLIPLNFSILYPFVKDSGAWRLDFYMALPALALLAWWLLKNRDTYRSHLMGVAMYMLPLSLMLPIISVGTAEMRNDRYVYLPSLGVFFILMLLAEKIKPALLRFGLLGGIALIFIFQANKQSAVWKDGTALFKNCVDNTPQAALCQCNLGYSELLSLKFEESVEHYSNALDLDPTYVEAYNGRGQAYLNLNKFPEALADFTKAVEAGIVTPKLFFNKGKCLAILSNFEEAIPDLTRSIELEPKSAETYYFRAFCYEKTGKAAMAVTDYSKAIDLNPNYVEALVNRGLLFYNDANFKQSIEDNTKAIKIASGNILPMVLVNRANAYLKTNDLQAALADANQAIDINANYTRAFQTRAAIYTRLGKPDLAAADLQKLK